MPLDVCGCPTEPAKAHRAATQSLELAEASGHKRKKAQVVVVPATRRGIREESQLM
jgi:hypothetical protein